MPLHRNTTEVHIGDKKTFALVDTGASISVVSKEFFDKTCYAKSQMHESKYNVIKGVGGDRLLVLGRVVLEVKIGGKALEYPFHVIENIHHSLILGEDFFSNKLWNKNPPH